MSKKQPTHEQATMAALGEVMARVAKAAEQLLPGIACERMASGTRHGMRYDIPQLGSIFIWEDGKITLGGCGYGQEVNLALMPGLAHLCAALTGYARRKAEAADQRSREIRLAILDREAERIRDWQPEALLEAVQRAQQRVQDYSDEPDAYLGH